MIEIELETQRLRLIPLNLTNLLLLQKSRALMEKNLGLNISQMVIEPHIQIEMNDAIEFWIARVNENEKNYFWFTNWEAILKEKNLSIGGIGLIGAPDKNGEVTIGYGFDGMYHGQGFATEALQAMVQWVFKNKYAKKILAETLNDNYASHKVLIKNGFTKVAEKDLLFVWKIDKSSYLHRTLRELTQKV